LNDDFIPVLRWMMDAHWRPSSNFDKPRKGGVSPPFVLLRNGRKVIRIREMTDEEKEEYRSKTGTVIVVD
jgi:hypothetical protein